MHCQYGLLYKLRAVFGKQLGWDTVVSNPVLEDDVSNSSGVSFGSRYLPIDFSVAVCHHDPELATLFRLW